MRVVKIAATAALLSLSFGSFAEENNDAPAAQTAVQSNGSFGYISADVFLELRKLITHSVVRWSEAQRVKR
jgi:hypothetical protein